MYSFLAALLTIGHQQKNAEKFGTFKESLYFCRNCVRMIRNLLKIILPFFLLLCIPNNTQAATAVEIIEAEFQDITVTLKDNTLHVAGASGEMLYVYNLTGVRVMSVRIEGADRQFELNLPKGCYIVKVGKVVRKISINK